MIPSGSISELQNTRQIEHLLQHSGPHAVLKIMVNILSIILPTWALQPTYSVLYIMDVYIIPSKTLPATQSVKTICICRMSAPLEWEIIHIMWLQALVLLWRVKCCDPDHAHQCWCPHDYRWGLNTSVFIRSGCDFYPSCYAFNGKDHKYMKGSPGREK